MSKNIEEIVKFLDEIADYGCENFKVRNVTHYVQINCWWFCRMARKAHELRNELKQALTEKKLVVPMSEESIREIMRKDHALNHVLHDEVADRVAKAIYQDQFGGNK